MSGLRPLRSGLPRREKTVGNGRWILPGIWVGPMGAPNTTAGDLGGAVNRGLYHPIPIAVGGAIDRLALEIVVAGSEGDTVQLGAFTADVDDPLNLTLIAEGSIDVSSTGFKEVEVDAYVPPGILWVASLTTVRTGAPTSRRVAAGFAAFLGESTSSQLRNGIQTVGVADWVTPLPTNSLSSNAPYILVRGA